MKSPSMHQRLKQLAVPLLAVLLAACAQAPSAPEAVFAPNANLVVQGIPPIPQSLVDRVARYTDFRGHAFVDWHPTQRQMLVAHRKAGDTLPQLYLVDGPLAKPQQLTQGSEPVWSGSFEPRQGRYLVFERSVGGNEAGQLHRLDLATRQTTLLTNPDERHSLQGWLHGSSRALVSSVPLDRTAQGGRRADINTTLWLTDPLQPGSRQVVAQLPGGGWFNAQISRDDRQIAITNYRSASDSEIWLIDVASGQRRRVLPAAGQGPAASHYRKRFRK